MDNTGAEVQMTIRRVSATSFCLQ